jgi:hypothetical protein
MAADVPNSLSVLDWGKIVSLALVGIVSSIVSAHYIRAKKPRRLPPGPRGIPFVGNVLDAPTEKHWLKFAELGDVWGVLPHCSILA